MNSIPSALLAPLVLLVACGGSATTAPATGNTAGGGGTASAGVRSIDWQNRTYESEAGAVTVKDGEATLEIDPEMPEMNGWFQVGAPSYGDVNGDGIEDAILITAFNGGGTGTFTSGEVYTVLPGANEPVLIGSIPGGDRGDGGLDDIKIEGGKIIVHRNLSQEDDGACCPSKLVREVWSWSGAAFAEDEAARQVMDHPEYSPAE